MIYFLVLFQVFLLALGQILCKIGIDKIDGVTMENTLKIITSPYIVIGVAVNIPATLIWFYVLSKANGKFSMVYPLGSLAYVFGTLAAYFIFKESIPTIRWFGVCLIILGCACIARV